MWELMLELLESWKLKSELFADYFTGLLCLSSVKITRTENIVWYWQDMFICIQIYTDKECNEPLKLVNFISNKVTNTTTKWSYNILKLFQLPTSFNFNIYLTPTI